MESLIFLALFAGICLGMWLGTYYSEKVYKRALRALASKLFDALHGHTPTWDVTVIIQELKELGSDGTRV